MSSDLRHTRRGSRCRRLDLPAHERRAEQQFKKRRRRRLGLRRESHHQVRVGAWHADVLKDARESNKVAGIRPTQKKITVMEFRRVEPRIVSRSILQL